MHLYKTSKGNILQQNGNSFLLKQHWDELINQQDLYTHLLQLTATAEKTTKEYAEDLINHYLLPPVGSQEVWAAGVTYLRSRNARMEESEDSGGADCYQRVYEADRPELFFDDRHLRSASQ
jgi:2-dehydro-3-deoxy-D-arabinonate dehydratase